MTVLALDHPALLDVARLPLDAAGAVPDALGLLSYGATAQAADDVPGTLLWPARPQVDAWTGGAAEISGGRHGSVRWRTNGHWLFGAAEFDEHATAGGIEAQTHRIYADLFQTLKQTGFPHLLRLWNYLPEINRAGTGGLERYRQFNIGRQQAFVEAAYAAYEGAPAACALGAPPGPFRVRFLAARQPALPIENPRQTSAYHYPADYGPRSPTFSRAALADAGGGRVALLVSGTASIVGHTTQHIGDVVAQAHETLANLQALTSAASRQCTAAFSVADLQPVAYVRHAADWPKVSDLLMDRLGSGLVALQADVCRSDLLVEVEAHALAPGRILAAPRHGTAACN